MRADVLLSDPQVGSPAIVQAVVRLGYDAKLRAEVGQVSFPPSEHLSSSPQACPHNTGAEEREGQLG